MPQEDIFDTKIYGIIFDRWFRNQGGLDPDDEDKRIIADIVKHYDFNDKPELKESVTAIITAFVAGMNNGIEIALQAQGGNNE